MKPIETTRNRAYQSLKNIWPTDAQLPAARWKWMAGAAAAGSAVAGNPAAAETVQITQVDNTLSGPATQSTLRADLTGDMIDDLQNLVQQTVSNPYSGPTSTFPLKAFSPSTAYGYAAFARFSSNRIIGSAFYKYGPTSSTTTFFASVGGTVTANSSSNTVSVQALVPVAFSDENINGGILTNGFIDVQSSNDYYRNHVIQIFRLVFDDNDTAAPTGVVAGGDPFPEWAPPAPPAPEIEILGNGISILDGDITPSAGDDTDFGNVAVGDAVVHSLQVRNSGGADLTITSIDASPGDFAVTAVPMIVAPGTSEDFNVTFIPGSLGNKTATITVISDDADESSFTFDVSGVGVEEAASGSGNPAPSAAANPNLVRKASLKRQIKKFKKKLAQAKKDGNVRKSGVFARKIKKFKKRLRNL